MLPKILWIDVDWKLGWDNTSELRVLVNRLPRDDEMMYERDEKGIYLAVCGDVVQYYFHSDPSERPDKGFGGRVYELKMKSGETVRLAGPWSTRAGCVNESFVPTVDVQLTDDPEVMRKESGFYAGAVTLEAVNWWLIKNCRRMSMLWGMRRRVVEGELMWVPHTLNGGDCPTCKGWGRIPLMMTHRVGEEMLECPRCHGMGSVRYGMENRCVDRKESDKREDDFRTSAVGYQILKG